MTTPQAFFGEMIEKVMGKTLAAAGFELQDYPMYQMRGLFRYRKTLPDSLSIFVEFQLLHYQGGVSRFRVNLLRNVGADARANADVKVETTLARLLWDDFGVEQLGERDYWWQFNNPGELGNAILEAGKLTFGFGIPWLEGTLHPDKTSGG